MGRALRHPATIGTALTAWAAVWLAAMCRAVGGLMDSTFTGTPANVVATCAFMLCSLANVAGVALVYRSHEPSPRGRLILVGFLLVAGVIDAVAIWLTWDVHQPGVPF